MASYDTEESSVENSQPYEVYRFLLGLDEFLYTSSEDTVTVDSRVYVPAEIQRGPISQGKRSRTRVLSVNLAASDAFAQRYVGPPPGTRATLSIFRVQRDDVTATPALIYSGTVKAVTFPKNGQFADIQVQSIESSTDRAVPRFTYMGMCNHILFDAACGVDPGLFQHVGTVTLVDGNDITINGLNASGLNFLGGFLSSSGDTEKRQILAQSGDVVTVLLPFEQDPDGTTVTAFAGCNRILKEDCAVVFNAEINFGGFAFVPKRNVFAAGL